MINGGFLGTTVATTTTATLGVFGPREVGRKSTNLVLGNPSDIWPTIQDPDFATVKALCHFDRIYYNSFVAAGAYENIVDGNNAFLLLPGNNLSTASVFGITPHVYKWKGNSHGVVGVANAGIRSSVGTGAGTGDFVAEIWIYITDNTGNQTLWDFTATDGNVLAPFVGITGTKLYVASNTFLGTVIITGATAVTINTWHHVVLARSGGSTRLYLDGAQEGATFVDGNSYLCQTIWLGQLTYGGNTGLQPLRGYIGEFRYNVGTARGFSGATIAVPTAAFPDY